MMQKKKLKAGILKRSSSDLFSQEILDSLGILDWGYTEESIPHTFEHYKAWTQNSAGSLNYLKDHRLSLRSDIKKVYPEFQAALVFLFDYQSEKKYLLNHDLHLVAGYSLAYSGEDYHFEIAKRLKTLFDFLNLEDSEFKISLDIQPILERDLAFRAGLGWFGKNSMLISREHGSYFLIGSLLLNQKLDLDKGQISTDHCGKCTMCIEACPTQAIDPEKRTIKADLCLSTFTIETMHEADAPAGYENSRGEIFGCDICQDICPWNHKVLRTKDIEPFMSSKSLHLIEWLQRDPKLIIAELDMMSKRGVKKFFQGSVFERPGKVGWIKNLKAKLKLNI